MIFRIIQKGLHYIPEGADFVNLIASRMNNNRLSTSNKPNIDIDSSPRKLVARSPKERVLRFASGGGRKN